jgi:hypothetical protein
MDVVMHTHAAWRRLVAGDVHPGDLWTAGAVAAEKEKEEEKKQ